VHLDEILHAGRHLTLVALEHPELLRSAVVNDPGVPALIADMPDGQPLVAERAKSFGEMKEVALAGDNAKAAVLLYDWVEGTKGAFYKLSEVRRERWLANASTMRPMRSQPAPPSISCATLGKMKVPMLVTRGKHDNPFYVLNTDTFASCLPQGTALQLSRMPRTLWAGIPPLVRQCSRSWQNTQNAEQKRSLRRRTFWLALTFQRGRFVLALQSGGIAFVRRAKLRLTTTERQMLEPASVRVNDRTGEGLPTSPRLA
jgi:hypothetical protein